MASAKHHRYGQGGSKHKGIRNSDRPNGKAWKVDSKVRGQRQIETNKRMGKS